MHIYLQRLAPQLLLFDIDILLAVHYLVADQGL